ncbi:MAG: CoA-acylating methylmalonate-semialdehyde dehydrogenase [Vicinamibacterales bacterium]
MSTATATGPITCRFHAGGDWRASAATAFDEVHDPATGAVIARTPRCTREEVDAAVAGAHEAYLSWRRVPAPVRARVLFRYRDLLDRHADELAHLVTREHGKTLDDARGEVLRGMEVVEFACGIPSLLMGETLNDVSTRIDSHSFRLPIGVAVGITPFNFPMMVPLWSMPIAVACGNAFVFKPSEKVPLTAMRLVELFYEAGLPAGVVSIVHGAREQVEQLIDHPLVRAVSIVGSSAAAAAVYARAAAAGKRVQALGGAKNHMVVMPDCDLDQTVEAVINSAFGSAGQRCMAGSVAVAVEPVADRFLQRLAARAGALRLGPGDGAGCELGPLVSAPQRDRVTGYIELGLAEGATLLLDGRERAAGDGYFLGATIFDRVTPSMRIAREEIFGPVLSVVRVASLAEALEVVNRSEMGNAGVIFTRDGGAARTFTLECEAGMIGVNVGVPVPMAFFPFAGWKGSFFGDLHAHGKDGVRFYTEQKVVTARYF